MNANISHRLEEYANSLAQGQRKPQRKFIRDILYGMCTSHSIMLSDSSRALDESKDLLYTEKRLSRNLNSDRLSDGQLRQKYLERVSERTEKAVIAVDLTAIAKPYSKAQECLGWVREESKKTIARGYWAVHVHCIRPDGEHIPLWLEPYSTTAPGFQSQNTRW